MHVIKLQLHFLQNSLSILLCFAHSATFVTISCYYAERFFIFVFPLEQIFLILHTIL